MTWLPNHSFDSEQLSTTFNYYSSVVDEYITDLPHLPFNPKSNPKRARLVAAGLACCVFVVSTLLFLSLASTLASLFVRDPTSISDLIYSKSFASKSRGFVYNDALTLTITHSPYIYPDLTKLDEYRKHRYVEAGGDGTKVDSKSHAIIYKPRNGRNFKKQVNPKLLHLATTQGDKFEQDHMDPPIVLVVGLDADRYPRKYLELIVQDRLAYAQKHGYGLFIRYLQDFEYDDDADMTSRPREAGAQGSSKLSPLEFAKIKLMREAMFSFSSSAWFWWLDQDAIIVNHEYDVGTELVYNKEELSRAMLRDSPIIPPESIIHTYKHISGAQVRLILLQNDWGINMSSFMIRQDPLYGRLLMDYLMDPLHRTYQGFRNVGTGKALNFAMTHLLQWHPLVLSRMALVSSSILGAYPEDNFILKGRMYKKGDFVYLLKSSLINNRGVLDVEFIMDEWLIMKNIKN